MIQRDLTIIQGETFLKEVGFKVNDRRYPLTGYTAKSQIRPFIGSPELTEEFTCTVNEEEGTVRMELNPIQTNKLKKHIYYYDLLLMKGGTNTYYIGGKIFVHKHITEPYNE